MAKQAVSPVVSPMLTWVFLRGLMRESRHWGGFPAIFEEALPGARVIALDQPGNGLLHAEKSPMNVADIVEACREELVRRGLTPPYHVLAMSLGAMVALSWAAKYPHELNGCVLINTSVRTFCGFHERLRPRNYPVLLRLALPGASAADWERRVLALTSNQATEREQLLADWMEYRRTAPVTRINVLRQLVAAFRCRAPLLAPPVPMLVLASSRDGLVAAECSRRLARQWVTHYAEHPTAGHDLPLDDGRWVTQHVAAWLGFSDRRVDSHGEVTLDEQGVRDGTPYRPARRGSERTYSPSLAQVEQGKKSALP